MDHDQPSYSEICEAKRRKREEEAFREITQKHKINHKPSNFPYQNIFPNKTQKIQNYDEKIYAKT